MWKVCGIWDGRRDSRVQWTDCPPGTCFAEEPNTRIWRARLRLVRSGGVLVRAEIIVGVGPSELALVVLHLMASGAPYKSLSPMLVTFALELGLVLPCGLRQERFLAEKASKRIGPRKVPQNLLPVVFHQQHHVKWNAHRSLTAGMHCLSVSSPEVHLSNECSQRNDCHQDSQQNPTKVETPRVEDLLLHPANLPKPLNPCYTCITRRTQRQQVSSRFLLAHESKIPPPWQPPNFARQ